MPRFALFFLLLAPLIALHSDDALRYEVEYLGLPDSTIKKRLKQSTNLHQMRSTHPASLTALRRRAEQDRSNILKVMESFGYYDATLQFGYRQKSPGKAIVDVQITPGELYRLSDYQIRGADLPERVLEPGQPAMAKVIKKNEKLILKDLEKQGYPLAYIRSSTATGDKALKTIEMLVEVEPGPKVFFGPVEFKGLESVQERAVQRKIYWKPGDLYDAEVVAETRSALTRSGLFSFTTFQLAETPDENGQFPVTIEVQERKHRTIGLGLTYSNYTDIGVAAEWEHRNLRGTGDRLSLELDANGRQQTGSAIYRSPDFRRARQDLIITAKSTREQQRSFDAEEYEATIELERRINRYFDISAGAGLKHLITKRSTRNETETLLTVPITLDYNTTDEPLDPSTGWDIRYQINPHTRVPTGDLFYLQQFFSAATYWETIERRKLIIASQITLGSIIGTSLTNIPFSERFYAGSDRLLRGYKFRSVSPTVAGGAIGGRSMMIGSIEARTKFDKNWGLVAFFDAGNVSRSNAPDFRGKILKSVGLGARYHTKFGPFRLDFALPLDKRKGIDRDWEFYMSFGQSF